MIFWCATCSKFPLEHPESGVIKTNRLKRLQKWIRGFRGGRVHVCTLNWTVCIYERCSPIQYASAKYCRVARLLNIRLHKHKNAIRHRACKFLADLAKNCPEMDKWRFLSFWPLFRSYDIRCHKFLWIWPKNLDERWQQWRSISERTSNRILNTQRRHLYSHTHTHKPRTPFPIHIFLNYLLFFNSAIGKATPFLSELFHKKASLARGTFAKYELIYCNCSTLFAQIRTCICKLLYTVYKCCLHTRS